MGVKDYDLNPDNNTQINGINIAEGCPPSGINNAIRQLMADVKADSDAQNEALTTFSETPASAENLGPVKVGDGLSMGEDGTLSANLATAEAAGRVKASTTAQAGAVPLGGDDGSLGEDWLKAAMDAAREAENNSLPKNSAGYRLIVSSEDTEHSGDYVIKSSVLPKEISLSSTYDFDNPFGESPCIVIVEIKDETGGVWSPQVMAQPNSANLANNYVGVFGGSVGNKIRVVTGQTFLSRRVSQDGWLGNVGGGGITKAPCRVHVWKLMP